MQYGRNDGTVDNLNIDEIKQKISEQAPGLDIDGMSANDIKNLIVNEINTNKNIKLEDSVKEKINNGDVDGLKEEIIRYLSNNGGNNANTQHIIKMLKDNDMDGIKNQLLSMLFGGIGSQKKNEIDNNVGEAAMSQDQKTFEGMDVQSMLDGLMDKIFSNAKNDKRIMLLNSMKPFLSETRQKSIEDCVRIMNFIVFFENFSNKAGS